MVGLWIWLLSTVAFASAGRHAVVVRPLRIYTQDADAAKEAGAALSLYFNVSLHPNFNLSCDQLISTAQIFNDATPVFIVSEKSGRCPSEPWTGAFLVDLSSDVVDWPSYADQLDRNPNVPPPMEMYQKEKVSLTPEMTDTTTSTIAPSGLLVPIWMFVLLVIVLLLLIIGAGVLAWMVLKKKPTKDVETGDKTEKPAKKTSIPAPQEKTTTSGKESSQRSTRSTRSQKSQKSTTSKSSESGKNEKTKKPPKKKIEKCSTIEEERSGREREKASSAPKRSVENTKDDSEICQLRSDQAELIPEPSPPPQRSLDKRLEEPVTKEEFLYNMLKLTKQMVEYCEDSLIYPVTTTEQPGFLFKQFQGDVPKEPGNLQTIQEMTDFIKSTILPGMTHSQHPRFHSYIACGRSYPDILAEMLLASLGVVGSTWEACPALVEMEYSMVNWIGKALGLPEVFLFKEEIGQSTGGGSFVETSTEAILCTVMAARQWKIRELAEKSVSKTDMEGIHYDLETMHDQAKKLVFYASREAHSSMEKSCKLAMVRCRSVATLPENNWRMTASQLEQNILKDRERGLVPTYVLVTLGSTTTGACDDLAGIVDVAKKYGLYVHVDAGSSGIFWIDPKYRNNCKGLEAVDSLNVSLHKAMLQSASAAVLFTRDKKILLDAMAVTPEYSPSTSPDSAGIVDLRDWGLLSSRKFKALKTWFVFKFYGVEGIRRYLKNAVEMSDYFMSKVQAHPKLNVFSMSAYGQFSFQFVGEKNWTREQINTATSQLARHLNQSTKILVSPANVGGNNVIRIATSMERTPKWSVDDTFSTMCDLIDEFKHTKSHQLPDNFVECRPANSVTLYRKRNGGGLIGSANLVTDRTIYSTSEMGSLKTAEPDHAKK